MLKKLLKKYPSIWMLTIKIYRWLNPIAKNPLMAIKRYIEFFCDWREYVKLGGKAKLIDAYPCLFDKIATTPFDAQYFYQAVWASSKINKAQPETHVDVGSDIKFVGMLSAICKVEFVDIRPLEVNLPNFVSVDGSILNLPYADGAVQSLSCMHVIEHIGLGRYGDPLDPDGSRKACAELQRVLADGGKLYLSVPIGSPRVQFNGQRILSVSEVFDFLPGLMLVEVGLVDNEGKYHSVIEVDDICFNEAAGSDFALGCFEFTKDMKSN